MPTPRQTILAEVALSPRIYQNPHRMESSRQIVGSTIPGLSAA